MLPGHSPVSLRDPAGRLLAVEGRILRLIHPEWVPPFQAFLKSHTAQQYVAAGRLVRTQVLEPAAVEALLEDERLRVFREAGALGMVVEHEAVAFPSFPHEWPAEMLSAAGRLTLELATALVPEGFGIKDATPYNLLFRGPEPVFIDLLSIEPRDSRDPVWLAYAQFVRTFLLPLLAYRKFRTPPHQLFLTHRDGLEPEEFYQWCGPLEKLRPPALALASIPTWFHSASERDPSLYQKKAVDNPAKARFILTALLSRLSKTLKKLTPGPVNKSAWSQYMTSQLTYTGEEFQSKESFVRQALDRFRPRRVLDIGCNTGHFSRLAARGGARVVAIDSDAGVVGELWRQARSESLDILPLAVNLTRPSPALGWRNRELPAFLDRARGGFDAVLMLAVIHHLLVTDGIPLSEILDLAAELTTGICVAEFVGPGDPMFRRLLRGREALYQGLALPAFETVCQERFQILDSRRLGNAERWIYLLGKKK